MIGARTLHLLPRPALTRIIRNTAFMWSACRAAGYATMVHALPIAGPPLIVVLVVVLIWLQMRWWGEFPLLANLGVSVRAPLVIVGIVTAILETMLWSALSFLGLWSLAVAP